ncbi:MAG TPA: transposase family protein, partial [Streptosporangiaceae bacterium]|nr:transposase family protein [Streptosporangiaceae bacterium]
PPPRPQPPPGPAAAARAAILAALAHPALTGITAAGLASLAARLELPAAAAREHRLHLATGHPRRRAAAAPPKLTLTAQLTATLVRARLGLPLHVLAYLLGVSTDTISPAVKNTSDLLARHNIALPARAASLATLNDLHRYATAAGITIPGLPQSAGPHE